MGKAGRKNKYETHVKPYIDKIKMWKRDGYHEEQIAKMLGVAVSTFNLYKKSHSELSDTLKTGKEDLIADLEKTLYQKAKGVEYEEVKTVIEKDGQGKDKKKIEKTKKWIPPDTTALIFTLKNLRPDKWRDQQIIELRRLKYELDKRIVELREEEQKTKGW